MGIAEGMVEVEHPFVSILLPTRHRPGALRRSVASLVDRAAGSVEILLAVDDDDGLTLDDLGQSPIPGSHLFVGPRLGYANLHMYVNFLAARANGDWLFLWNDDAVMETLHWDVVVASFGDRFAVLNPDSNQATTRRLRVSLRSCQPSCLENLATYRAATTTTRTSSMLLTVSASERTWRSTCGMSGPTSRATTMTTCTTSASLRRASFSDEKCNRGSWQTLSDCGRWCRSGQTGNEVRIRRSRKVGAALCARDGTLRGSPCLWHGHEQGGPRIRPYSAHSISRGTSARTAR